MPLYAYECEACHFEFERQQSFADDPIRICPNCGEPSARRLIMPVGVIFKGPGFYVTDNRRTSNNDKKSDSGRSPASKTKESESKTA
ncbi:MAG: zinc ribbon domain-containing protein [Chloroflexi bacterium]|nr:MAG: zinc ribbon domain-containing protein [Chloroflexota bacterium]